MGQSRAGIKVDGSDSETPFPRAIPPVSAGGGSTLAAGPEELLWRLKRAQALAQMGSWEWTIPSGELLWSDEIFSLFGLPIDAFGASYSAFLERVHPDDRAQVEEAVRLAVEEGADYALDHRIVRPDGEIRFVHEYGEVERDRAGVPLRMRGIVQDVTRSRAVERSATRNRDMLSGMFRISPEAIVVANEEGRVVIFSAGAEAVFGYAAHEIVGGPIERLMPERFRGDHGRHVARFAAGPSDSLQMAQRRPIRGLRKDGVEIPIEASLARIVAGGETLFTTIVRDLTERYETEVSLVEARERAEQANRAKSIFLANMSHELRTPLNGILGVAEALATSASDSRQKEMVDLIATSARALEALLTDILDLARIEAGRLDIQNEPFDLGVMVRSVAALFAASAESKGLSFNLDLPDSAALTLSGDCMRLRQILNNLLSNAVKFTETGGVTLAVETDCSVSPCRVRFSVHDTGIGFDDEVGTRLFQPFEQSDSSITRRFGGTGLGLSICRRLVELMGGTIEARSVAGRGSTFSFEVTLAPATLEPVEAVEIPEWTGQPLRVLLAEDHPVNRRVVELILEPVGIEVCSVENGELAVAEAAAGSFDLVLMDMQMPVMDGLEAVRRIRGREGEAGLPHVPICMLTANALPHFQAQALEAGADGFLTKPISAMALIQKIAQLASKADASDVTT
ncbi:MAG: ATP-binding protein [Brevundimonas sp.]|uniref:PAS domain-containing hybrid sensor histidine kinase/response regulator n=1 Tax=Brevundimonas sp. TaxID=1871086 RepID=UPI00260530E2|nr:ATP-binding protein [Brevundimonas sp.]MDI6623575.1 ATP-binding protein [Brevundimonas sp.]MDQ7812581.1 ATP-binding protein [Brevundimonas sp.]